MARYSRTPESLLKSVDKSLERAIVIDGIQQQDIQLMRDYLNEKYSQSRIGENRMAKLAHCLVIVRKALNRPFQDATYSDILETLTRIKHMSNPKTGNPYSFNAVHDFSWQLKNFFQYLIKNELSTIPYEKINELKLPKTNKMTVKIGDLPTSDEIEMFLSNFDDIRFKFAFSLQVRGALRIGEVASLKFEQIREVPRSEDGIPEHLELSINFKTGITRFIPIFGCNQLYHELLAEYPIKNPSPSDFVITHRKTTESLSYNAIRKHFDKAAKIVDKPLHPHLLRHYAIYNMLVPEDKTKQPVDTSIIRRLCWNSNSSHVLETTYLHLRASDITYALALNQTKGVEQQKEDVTSHSKKCPGCGAEIHDNTAIECPFCYHKL